MVPSASDQGRTRTQTPIGRVIDGLAGLEMLRLYTDGQTIDEIATEFSVARSTVSRALKRVNAGSPAPGSLPRLTGR